MLLHDSVALYVHYIILYVSKGKMFWFVCISNVTSVGGVYLSSFKLFCIF